MHAARMRVVHVITLVAIPIVLISVGLFTRSTTTVRDLPGIVVWVVGCEMICVFSRVWYGARAKATDRLTDAVKNGAGEIRVVEVTRFKLEHIPFGCDVDVELGNADHLAFGFWTLDPATRLQRLLQRVAGSPSA
jgi:hypothetical protein